MSLYPTAPTLQITSKSIADIDSALCIAKGLTILKAEKDIIVELDIVTARRQGSSPKSQSSANRHFRQLTYCRLASQKVADNEFNETRDRDD